MIDEVIFELKSKNNLSYDQTKTVMSEILTGGTTDVQNEEFLNYLSIKGETDEELTAMLDKMHEYSVKVESKNKDNIIDMCGTGGDKLQTFNISTTASFIVAASGGIVAKHGNRSSSGVSGSADIFEYFGYDLNLGPEKISDVLEKFKICFMFAPRYHPAMKYVSNARKKLGKRTAFNLLGPLSNPAGVKNQLIGVSSIEFLDRLPNILRENGAKNIMTVRSDDGMDEFSTNSVNRVCILRNNKILTNAIDPEILGLHKSRLEHIQIKTKQEAIKSFVSVLDGTANKAMTETTALNAAGGLIVADVAKNFDDAIEIAMSSINEGNAFKLLEKFVRETGDISKLKMVQE